MNDFSDTTDFVSFMNQENFSKMVNSREEKLDSSVSTSNIEFDDIYKQNMTDFTEKSSEMEKDSDIEMSDNSLVSILDTSEQNGISDKSSYENRPLPRCMKVPTIQPCSKQVILFQISKVL